MFISLIQIQSQNKLQINPNKITIAIKLNNTRKNIAHYILFHGKCAHIFRKVAGWGKKKKTTGNCSQNAH